MPRTRKSIGLNKLVRVQWRDHWDGDTWTKLEALENDCLVESVGVVVRETSEYLTIASHRVVGGSNAGLLGTPTTIWKALVEAVVVIEE